MKQASKVTASVFGSMAVGLLIAGSTFVGCKKDEPPPPLPSAAPAAAPTPSAPLELAPEPVASTAPVDSAKKPTGVGGPSQSFSNCCKALLQNAQSAPEPNKTYMITAGNMCTSMVAAGQGGPTIVSALQGVLRGVGMPSACR